MKIFFTLTILLWSAALSSATLKLLKSKLNSKAAGRYRTVNYLVPPVVAPATVYSAPVSTFNTHVSSYRAPAYAVPHAAYLETYIPPAAHVASLAVVSSPPPPPPPPQPVTASSEWVAYPEYVNYVEFVPFWEEPIFETHFFGKTYSDK